MKFYYQLIPEKILQNLPYIDNLLKSQIKGYSSDNLKQVISIVAFHIRKDDNLAQLKMTYIMKAVPQGEKYMKALINHKMIQRSGTPIKGEKSYSYCFTPKYNSRYISMPLNNAKLIRRQERLQEEVRKAVCKTVRRCSVQAIQLKKLTLDTGYLEYVNRTYSADLNQYNSILSSATRILNRDFTFSRDCTSARFHSNITNMAKGLRPFLRINGMPLANIDIKNSQPLISTIILTDPSKVAGMTRNPDFAMLLNNLKVPQSEDVKQYITLVASGQIYEFLMGEFAREGVELTRAETKVQLLRILFSRNRLPKDGTNRKCRQIFTERFPVVHKTFSKVRGSAKGDKFTSFERFAILLQTIESHLILDVILKRIHKELPGTIALTIHDSIMTGILSDNIEAVSRIMVEEITKFIGCTPKIAVEGILGKKEEKIIYN